MNIANFNTWLEDLATTTAPQCTGLLSAAGVADGPVGYCCLGRGEVARGGTKEGRLTLNARLATFEFIDWLGLGDSHRDYCSWLRSGERCTHEFDLFVDIPVKFDDSWMHVQASASDMNDKGFTFAQIADVFRHFRYSVAVSQ